jgi:23S rRNA (guanine745-N1)-methyltransferase
VPVPPARLAALDAVLTALRCPHCAAPLTRSGAVLACARGHRYDIARRGDVALLPPGGRRHAGDSAPMVTARAAFLGAGHFAPITAAIVAAAREALAPAASSCVVDVGAGTGHHLAAVLDALPGRPGLALDVSPPALRRALRARPRIAAVGCDAWGGLPLRDGAAGLVLNVFAPRNGAEFARVLAPGGALIVVTPTPRHLAGLRPVMGTLEVDPAKPARLHAEVSRWFDAARRSTVEFELHLSRDAARALVAMGPSARHVDDLDERLARLPAPLTVTASVQVATFSRRERALPRH